MLLCTLSDACLGHSVNHTNRVAWVFFRHLSDGEYAIGFFNFADHTAVVPFYTFNAGLVAGCGRAFVMRDLITGEEVGPIKDYYNPTIESHGCKIFRAKVVKL